MTTEKLKRGIGSVVAAGLVISGASLALAAPANAADTTVNAIAPNEDSYLGWHEGTTHGASVSSLKWNGVTFGINSDSQILNGLVATGAPGIEIDPTDLEELITSASVDVTSGAALLQVPITFGESGWSTLRPAVGATTSASPTAEDLWVSSKPINETAQNTPTPLSIIIDELTTTGSLRYSGFGMYAQASAPATVSSMTWDGDTYTFARAFNPIAQSDTVGVKAGDIRDNEETYAGWHEGYNNETPAFSVLADGLHLGGVGNSQIINGLATPLATADLASLIGSADVQATGRAFFQVALTFGDGTFTTLRPANPDTTFALGSDWVSSKDIPATASTAAIAKNTPVAVGDLAAAVEAHANVTVLGFGVLAESGAPAVVSSLLWNGVRYNFVPVVITPPTTAPPTTPKPTEPPVTPTPTPTVPPVTPPVTEPTTPPVTPVAPVEPSIPAAGSGVPTESNPAQGGSTFTLTVTGMTPNSDVEIYLHSTPVLLGTFRSDAQGVVTATVTIPLGTEVGTHHLVFTDVATGKSVTSAAFSVQAAGSSAPAGTSTSPTALAQTGSNGQLMLGLAALLMLAGLAIGGVQIVGARRRAAQR
jgi:hypothetical protein